MNLLTPAQRRFLFPPGTGRYELWARVRGWQWRLEHFVCFNGSGVRWFVRCRCGRHAVVHWESNVGRRNVKSRWFCRLHAPMRTP